MLIAALFAGCRSSDAPKAGQLAQQAVSSGFSTAAPQWTTSRNCPIASADFYQCSYWVSVSNYRSAFPGGPGGAPPPPPRLFKSFSATAQRVTTGPNGTYSAKVSVVGVCAFSEPGSLFGQIYSCGGDGHAYQSIFDVSVRQEGMYGANWRILTVNEAHEIVQRRNEENRQARMDREAAAKKVQATANLETALKNNDYGAAQMALQDGANPNVDFGGIGRYPLFMAQTAEIAELLLKSGADVDGKGHEPPCPICRAAYYKKADMFQTLYAAGANTAVAVPQYFGSAEQELGNCSDSLFRNDPECLKMQEIMRKGHNPP